MKKWIILIIIFAWVSTASSAMVIRGYNKTVITFDENVPGVYKFKKGDKGKVNPAYNIGEPHGYSRTSSTEGNVMFSESVAASHQYHNGDGSKIGSATRFLPDGDQDGKSDKQNIGQNVMGVRPLTETKMDSHAYRLATNNDYAINGLYLRIQNKTGSTVYDWTFSATIYYGEPDSENFSILKCYYAIDDGTDPNTMTFIPFGTTPKVSFEAVITKSAGTIEELVTTPGVEDNRYIILAFKDIYPDAGSTIFIDNIGIIATKPAPSTVEISEEEIAPQPKQKITPSKKVIRTSPSSIFIFAIGLFSAISLLIVLGVYLSREKK